MTNENHYALTIGELPLEFYPLLIKFRTTEHIRFDPKNGGASDVKLAAISKLNWLRLRNLGLDGSRGVTDVGLASLKTIKTLQGLGLDQTDITDAGLKELAAFPALRGVNVSQCRNVTLRGIESVAALPGLEDIGFSTENLSSAELVHLVRTLKVRYCGIVDSRWELDIEALKAIARASGISLSVHPPAR